MRQPQLTKYRFRTKKDSSLEELVVILELKPAKSITAETPTNQDEASVQFSQDQWDIVSPMQPGHMVASGIWALRADYPGTPLDTRDEGGQGTPRKFSISRESVAESPPGIEMSYRGPPLQGAWTKPLGMIGLRDCCTPRGSGGGTSATPPTTVSPAPTVKAAEPSVTSRSGVASPQGTLHGFNRQGSHPNMAAKVDGAQATGGGAQDVRNKRHSLMQDSTLRAMDGNYGARGGNYGARDGNYSPRRISQPLYTRGNEYQRSESDSRAVVGPAGAGDQTNTSGPTANRTQSCGAVAKPHRTRR